MSSPEDRFSATTERTTIVEQQTKQPGSNPTYSMHECTQVWPSRDVGSQQTTSLAYDGSHRMAKRDPHKGGIWASIVRGCAAR